MSEYEQENFDWNAATRSVPWDEQEQQPLETEEIVKTWREQTPEGQAFSRDYNTPENRKALLAGLEIVGEISWPALSDTFIRLRENKKLLPYQAPPTQAEVEQSNKAKWEQQCRAWYEAPNRSTKEIRERAERDKAFASWLQNHRFEVVLEDAEAVPAQILGTDTPGFHPDQVTWQRKEERAQQKRDSEYLRIEQEHPGLHEFALSYKRLSAAETKRRMADPSFRDKVTQASEYGLI